MMYDEPLPDAGEPIDAGDVCLDLTQGRPVHALEVHDANAAEWSEANDYNLTGNYANGRLGAAEDDHVFECVYCSLIKSEPSKTYAFPESRLARVETEAADDGRRVADRARAQLLEEMFLMAENLEENRSVEAESFPEALYLIANHIESVDGNAFSEARELAETATFRADDDRGEPVRACGLQRWRVDGGLGSMSEDDWRDRPCAKCGAEDPMDTSPEWNLCADCDNHLRERYGNV